ncbi:hypothetical protein DFS33DRAFT_1274606 [Desarmillaria ectypa]|nr:hypothetical protein DFS33DRAFT_1274606 [Desarmillaria ectypa]
MRTFISNDNRQNNACGCLEIACKDEQIEDAVYALGTMFYLNSSDPGGRRHVRRGQADYIRRSSPDPHLALGEEAANADSRSKWPGVDPDTKSCKDTGQFELKVTDVKDGVFLTKSRRFKGAFTVIDEKKVESVLREKRRKDVTLEKHFFLKTHRAIASTSSQSVIEDPLSNLHTITNELRSFVADINGPRSMTISESAISLEVPQLATVFSLVVTPEPGTIVLTKKTQGPFVVSETKVADILNGNGKRPREGDDDDAEIPPDSPLPSDEEELGSANRESQHETRNLEQEIRKFVVDTQGPTSMTLYCPNNTKTLAVFLLAHPFGLLCSETPGSPYVKLTRTVNTTSQNINEASVKRLLEEIHPSFRAAQLIEEDAKRISDIKAFEKCLRAFIDDVETKAFSIPHTTDPRVTALAKVFHLRVNRRGDRMKLHRRLRAGTFRNDDPSDESEDLGGYFPAGCWICPGCTSLKKTGRASGKPEPPFAKDSGWYPNRTAWPGRRF